MVGLVLAAPLTAPAVHVSADLARAEAAAAAAAVKDFPRPAELEPATG